jgi:RND family efflux transporter MFP subunit
LKRTHRLHIVTLATILVTSGSLSSCSRSEAPQAAKAAGAESVPTTVPVVAVSRGDITNSVTVTAEFQPFQEVDVMAKVAGFVRTIKVDLGDHVREGQLLAELEIPEMTDEVSKAAAMVQQTGAEIAAARDELQRAESSHQIAHLSFTRLQDVAKREPGLIPQQELDEVRARDLVAEAQVATAKSKLRVEEQKTVVARAEETRLRTLRDYATISAPFAATVTKRYANVGSMIQAGIASQSQAMPLVRLSQISTLRLSLPVPESLVPSVHIGRPVETRVKSLGRAFEGRVARFASKVDPTTRTMVTEVDVANPSGIIKPGMFAEVALQVKNQQNVLTVPLEVIERAGSVTRVYTVDQAGLIRIVPVQLGIEDARRVEIVSGLEEGQHVITGRKAGLNAGDKATPKVMEAVP